MHRLRSLSLQTNLRLALSNRELCTLAIAWPEIEELSVYGLGSPTVNPSIDGLAHLASQCPRFAILVLPSLRLPSYINAAPVRILRHGLKAIDTVESIYGWSTVDIDRCAQILYSYFPNLDVEMVVQSLEPRNVQSNWSRVMERYLAMRPLAFTRS